MERNTRQVHPIVRKALRAERIHGVSSAHPGRSSGAERRRNGPRSAAGGEPTTHPRLSQQRWHRHCPARPLQRVVELSAPRSCALPAAACI